MLIVRASAPADIFTVRAHALIDGQSSGAGHPRYGGARYEVVNRDTAVTIARAAATDGAEAMVFISAATAPPGVDKRCVDHNVLPVSTDAGYNPRDQWDDHLSKGRYGTSTTAA
jgi:hypothetical protein